MFKASKERMKEKIKLSIIIVNFETPDYTLGCIDSLFANPPGCSFEVLLIDNGSSDGSLDLIREKRPEVICIESGSNLGFSKANNLGLHNARGEYVLLLNSDTKILDDAIGRLTVYLDECPEVGVVGCKQLDGHGRLQLSWGAFPTFVSEIYRKLLHGRLSINDLRVREYLEEKYAGSNEVEWVSGSCLMARREALFQAGLLDENFFMYFEDIDLCRNVRDKGWKIHFSSETTIVHYGGVSAKKNLLRVLVIYRKSQIYFTKKYYGMSGVLVLKSMLMLKYGVYAGRSAFLFIARSMVSRDTKIQYTELLLCKKVFELVFGKKAVSEISGT